MKWNVAPEGNAEVVLMALMGGSIHTPREIADAVGEYICNQILSVSLTVFLETP